MVGWSHLPSPPPDVAQLTWPKMAHYEVLVGRHRMEESEKRLITSLRECVPERALPTARIYHKATRNGKSSWKCCHWTAVVYDKKDGASPGGSPTIFVTYVFLFLNWKRKRKTDSQRWKTLPHLPGQLPLITLISTKSPPQRSPPGIFPSLPVTPCSPHLMRYPWNSLITALLSG